MVFAEILQSAKAGNRIETSEQPGEPVNLGSASEWSSGFLAKDWPKSGFRTFLLGSDGNPNHLNFGALVW